MAEQLTCNQQVAGSSPISSSNGIKASGVFTISMKYCPTAILQHFANRNTLGSLCVSLLALLGKGLFLFCRVHDLIQGHGRRLLNLRHHMAVGI